MGGFGSGRTGDKLKAEECRSLDVNRMHRKGCLNAGWSGNWVWSRDGEEVARIGCRVETGRILLNYRVRQYPGDWEPISQQVPLDYVGCNYGGQRPYFRCPGTANGQQCGRRVSKLYAGGRFFLCRHCYSLSYCSQSEDRYDRLLRRANNLRLELGGKPGTAHPIAVKPKGMWTRTYQRKQFEIEWCENQANLEFVRKHSTFLGSQELEMVLLLD